jgi:sugar phosphate isomerase/epimerase
LSRIFRLEAMMGEFRQPVHGLLCRYGADVLRQGKPSRTISGNSAIRSAYSPERRYAGGHLAWGNGTQNLAEHLRILSKHDYRGYITFETCDGEFAMHPNDAFRQDREAVIKALASMEGRMSN